MVMAGAAVKDRTGVSDRNGITWNDTAGAVGAGVGAGVTAGAGAVTGARVAAGAQADSAAPSSATQVRERPFRE